MKPYWERDGISIYHGDNRDVVASVSPGTVVITVTSPPYNQRLDGFKASGFKAEGSAQWAHRAASSYFDSLPEDEYQLRQVDILNAVHEASAPSASLFYNHKCRWRDRVLLHPLDIVRRSRWNVRQEIIWSRDGSLTQNAKMFPPSEERIVWCFKDSWKWNPESNRFMSVWRVDSAKMTEHPVAYPIDIPMRAIEAASDLGDLVLDPFGGSMTTLVAAWQLGRTAIGCDISEEYCELGARRLEREMSQGRLKFDPEPSPTQRDLFDAERV